MSEKEEKPILTGPHESSSESDKKETKDDEFKGYLPEDLSIYLPVLYPIDFKQINNCLI